MNKIDLKLLSLAIVHYTQKEQNTDNMSALNVCDVMEIMNISTAEAMDYVTKSPLFELERRGGADTDKDRQVWATDEGITKYFRSITN